MNLFPGWIDRLPIIASIIAMAVPAAGAAAQKSNDVTVASALKPYVESHALAGAVAMVATRDAVLETTCVGWSDIAAQKPMRPNTLFWIASQSKAMTAAGLMMLVDEGKINLNDPVEKYLPEFRNLWLASETSQDHILLKRPHHAVTVREILSHTAGLPFSSAMEQPTLDVLSLRDGVRSYALTPLQYEPGSKYQYSNAGINTAGRLIEVISGMPYETFLQTRLFDPLGMKDTTFWPSKKQQQRLAVSYRPNTDKTNLEPTTVTQLRYPLEDRSRGPMPAGGLFSTAADVALFCRLLLNHGAFEGKRLLSEDAVHQMTTKQTGPEVADNYGLGLSTWDGGFGHGGAYSTNMSIDTKHGLIYIWMVQHAGYPLNGDQSFDAFRKAAEKRYAKP